MSKKNLHGLPVYQLNITKDEYRQISLIDNIDNEDELLDFLHHLYSFIKDTVENRWDLYSVKGENFAYIEMKNLALPVALSLPKRNIYKALQGILKDYEALEDYEMCTKVMELVKKVQTP